MIYSDEELKRWWAGLAESARQEVLQRMVQEAGSAEFSEFAMSLRRHWDERQFLTPRQLKAIRKWER